MKWLIIGAGAIGCLVGGKLAAQGVDVTLVGRPRFAAAVRDQGLRLTTDQGTQVVRALQVAGSLSEAAGSSSYDLAVFAVKSYDTAAALAELRSSAGESLPAVFSLQNGVGNEEALAAVFGANRVLAGVITTPVSVSEPGAITIEKPTLTIGFSPWSEDFSGVRLTEIQQELARAGFAVTPYPQAQGLKWSKLLMNMVGNATSAILDEAPGQVFADPHLVDLELAAWREALLVMRQAGIPAVNLGKYPFAWLAPLIRTLPNALLRPFLRRQVRGARGGKLPSLHLDLHSGKRHSEVTWLNGAVVRQGQLFGLPTPVNSALTETVLALASGEAPLDEWRHNHAGLLQRCRR